jgi:hypothetical protein
MLGGANSETLLDMSMIVMWVLEQLTSDIVHLSWVP